MKNQTSNYILPFLVVLICLSHALFAQENESNTSDPKMLNNAIYGNIGVGGLWFTATAYYERMLPRDPQKTKLSTFIKVGLGTVGYWEGESTYIQGQFGILTGVKKHHLEASAGYVKSLNDFDLFPVAATLGYRIQKPNGHFIFRTGVGWPEAVYVGLGGSF